jgi:hypothetical protein
MTFSLKKIKKITINGLLYAVCRVKIAWSAIFGDFMSEVQQIARR